MLKTQRVCDRRGCGKVAEPFRGQGFNPEYKTGWRVTYNPVEIKEGAKAPGHELRQLDYCQECFDKMGIANDAFEISMLGPT